MSVNSLYVAGLTLGSRVRCIEVLPYEEDRKPHRHTIYYGNSLVYGVGSFTVRLQKC